MYWIVRSPRTVASVDFVESKSIKTSSGAFLIEDHERTQEPTHVQTVSLLPSGEGVSVALVEQGEAYPFTLVFRTGKPWYEVVNPGGTLENEIVEVGMISRP